MGWQSARAADWGLAGAVVLVSAAVFYQPLCWLVATWSIDTYYGHGVLIPFISAYLVWHSRDGLRSLPCRPSRWGLTLLAVALLAAAVAIPRRAEFVASMALVVFLAGVVLYLRGWATLRALLFPLAYLLLAVPLPFVNDVAIQLQVGASALAAGLAGLSGVPVAQQGAALSVPGSNFVVGLACSGLNSSVALLALGVLLAYLVRGNLWARLVVVVSLAPVALLANGLRLGSLLWIAYRYGGEAALAYHDGVAGFLSWGLALAFLAGSFRLARCRLNLVASP
ncbi:MAG: exosortase/archaeosortase family protein [Chloroflexota bacterium]